MKYDIQMMNKMVNQNQIKNREKADIFKIVLTGGPCAGKTTAITILSEKLRENGFKVYIVPEAASTIFQSGGDIQVQHFKEDSQVKF